MSRPHAGWINHLSTSPSSDISFFSCHVLPSLRVTSFSLLLPFSWRLLLLASLFLDAPFSRQLFLVRFFFPLATFYLDTSKMRCASRKVQKSLELDTRLPGWATLIDAAAPMRVATRQPEKPAKTMCDAATLINIVAAAPTRVASS